MSDSTTATGPGVQASQVDTSLEAAYDTLPIKGMRAAIAAAMMSSLQGTAQLTLHRQFKSNSLVKFRQDFAEGDRPSLNDLFLRATSRALMDHPALNATIDEASKTIRRWKSVHLGMAVAIEEGLVVPVIKDAEKLSLRDLSATSSKLAEAARGGALSIKDIQGGTFTVTNLGSFGVDAFTPIINPPQVAILGIGRTNGDLSTLSLTVDHRAIDGVPAAKFLQHLSNILENAPQHLT